MLSPPKPLDEIQPNLVCELHEWGVQHQTFLTPPPGALGRGQISFNFNYKVNFKDFYTKLCVFSQMKDTKHIRRDFLSVTWVMPQGCDWGAGGAQGGQKKFKHGHVALNQGG